MADDVKLLPLDAAHRALGASMAAFAGYQCPIQYEGLIAEHLFARESAGLFDVSHMGPCLFSLHNGLGGEGAHAAIAAVLERALPSDIAGLKPGQMRYSVLLNAQGGVIDDLIVGRPAEAALQGSLYIVCNAARKAVDFPLLDALAPGEARVRPYEGVLLAVQGPRASAVVGEIVPEAAQLRFMHYLRAEQSPFGPLIVSRTGYTGDDGFEILAQPAFGAALWDRLVGDARVKPVGLGARDTLRLEAGLCLYGQDLDEQTSPVEAGLSWVIQKRRRDAGDFPGAERVLAELRDGPRRVRVGLLPKDRAPARAGVEIKAGADSIGAVTSGGFSPTLKAPISIGYVAAAHAQTGALVELLIRGKPHAAEIVSPTFLPHRYKKD